MKINEFAEKIRLAVSAELGSGYRVRIEKVRKNNGVLMYGMMVFAEDRTCVPAIYLESFWEAYESGVSFENVVESFLRLYREEMPDRRIDMNFFVHFDRVRDRICYRLVRRKGNEELLQESPYVEFLDLAVCFFYAFDGGGIGEGIIQIKNPHMMRWGVRIADLMRFAEKNTPGLFSCECLSMEEILEAESVRTDSGVPMKVLTNEKHFLGAASMLYPGTLEKLAAEAGKSFYILPASIHEVILLEDTGRESAQALKKMIREVNASHVAPEDVLSDNLYYYDLREKQVKIY